MVNAASRPIPPIGMALIGLCRGMVRRHTCIPYGKNIHLASGRRLKGLGGRYLRLDWIDNHQGTRVQKRAGHLVLITLSNHDSGHRTLNLR